MINDNDVRLRVIPSLDSQVVKLLQKSQQISVVGKSSRQVTVKQVQNYWYKVDTKDNDEGWVFGQFIQGVSPDVVPTIQIVDSGSFERASVEVLDGDPTEKRYFITVWRGQYDTTKNVSTQTDSSLIIAGLAIATNELKNGKYKGDYEAWFRTQPGKPIDSKVQEPVYVNITDSTIEIDTMGNLYEGGIHLTDTLEALHFTGPFEWIGDKR
jgi:hypothetical protein